MIDRYLMGGVLDVDRSADQVVRYAVVAFFYGNVVVDMHIGLTPVADAESFFRQWRKPAFLYFNEEFLAALAVLSHRAVVQCIKRFAYRSVELFEAEELPIPERTKDLPLHLQNAALNLTLILGLARTLAGSTSTE